MTSRSGGAEVDSTDAGSPWNVTLDELSCASSDVSPFKKNKNARNVSVHSVVL
jgi:hypothetical protein